jgi:preprotein translocase subunit Sss1
MSPKSMSSNESSCEGDNIVMRFNSNTNERNANSSNQMNNYIKFKLEDFPETCKKFIYIAASKRNIIQKRKPDYDEYIERSSSNKSKKKKSSIGNYKLIKLNIIFHLIFCHIFLIF